MVNKDLGFEYPAKNQALGVADFFDVIQRGWEFVAEEKTVKDSDELKLI